MITMGDNNICILLPKYREKIMQSYRHVLTTYLWMNLRKSGITMRVAAWPGGEPAR